jgi:hypothetical protein
VVFATALYSASVLDLDTVGCLRALQEIRLVPKNITYPPVDILSSIQPAWSASEKALTSNGLFLMNFNPILVLPLCIAIFS